MTEPRDIGAIFAEGSAIDAALAEAAVAARREALAWGQPLIVWQDGRVVELWPDDLARRGESSAQVPSAT